jgi:hypothetical protein
MPKWAELSDHQRCILVHDQILNAGAAYMPRYTADMNAAMTVIEALADRHYTFEAYARKHATDRHYEVRFWPIALYTYGTTLPEATCHAAALAVGAVED